MSDYIKTEKVLDLLAGVVAEIIMMQPEHTEEHTETHSCVCERTETHDLISRKAAIEAVLDRMNVEKHGRNAKPEEIRWTLEALPSAEPEIIRCKDCELFYKNMSPFGKHECDSGNENGYCFWVVRKEE